MIRSKEVRQKSRAFKVAFPAGSLTHRQRATAVEAFILRPCKLCQEYSKVELSAFYEVNFFLWEVCPVFVKLGC